jgi:Fibronectin type III domain
VPSAWGWVTSYGGKIQIDATEGTLDDTNNRSQITVVASIYNGNSNNAGPNAHTLSSNLTGSDPRGDNLGQAGPTWSVGTLAPGATKTIFTKTVWAAHDESGGGTATVGWNYASITDPQTAIFGDSGTIGVSVPLSQLTGAPTGGGSGVLTASNILAKSMTLSWDAVDGATYYYLIGSKGDSIASPFLEYEIGGSAPYSYNVTGLSAGSDYTWELQAGNSAGLGTPSDPQTFSTLAGAWVREGGVWVAAIPYIRVGGVWKMAQPYVRQAGVWTETH